MSQGVSFDIYNSKISTDNGKFSTFLGYNRFLPNFQRILRENSMKNQYFDRSIVQP